MVAASAVAHAALLAGILVLTALSGCSNPPAPVATGGPPLALSKVVDGLAQPVFVTPAPGGGLAIVEQGGLVRIFRDGILLDAPLLDVQDKVTSGGEQGLLGLAFAPNGGALFVDYTDTGGDTVIARYNLGADGRAEPESAASVLRIAQPYANHNGGMLAFGHDGMLYIGMGDGGSGGDPENRALDTRALLGKILRIDVAHPGRPDNKPRLYSIPADNPFADGGGGAPEVWAYGLRNPWRFSFDRQTADLWIGDVGQNQWEEIDMQPDAAGGGLDYGWSAWEGTHRYDEARQAPAAVPPVYEYSHAIADSCSVTGGYVYRGTAIPALQGTYLFSDYCSGQLWTLKKEAGAWRAGVTLTTGLHVSSFGEDLSGELYVVDHGGALYRIVAG